MYIVLFLLIILCYPTNNDIIGGGISVFHSICCYYHINNDVHGYS